ncbi:MAG: hypothetical protein ACE5FJ_05270 [Gemmatimonadales bacterium]
MLLELGFVDLEIEPTRIYSETDVRGFLSGKVADVDSLSRDLGGCIMGAFIRGTKPHRRLASRSQ